MKEGLEYRCVTKNNPLENTLVQSEWESKISEYNYQTPCTLELIYEATLITVVVVDCPCMTKL